MHRFVTLAVAATLALGGCSSTSVNTDWDRTTNFGSYTTFAWYDHSESDNPPNLPNQIVDTRIRRAVAENLISKGFAQAAPDKADLLVTYHTSIERQLRLNSYGWGYGYWGGWHSTHTSVQQYDTGTLILDVIDRSRSQLVWRGTLSKALSKSDTTDEKIRTAITKVLSEFPPAP